MISFLAARALFSRLSSYPRDLYFALAIAFINFEFSWILNFFPTSYYVNAAILSMLYAFYLDIASVILNQSGGIRWPELLEQSVVGAVGMILIFITASWR